MHEDDGSSSTDSDERLGIGWDADLEWDGVCVDEGRDSYIGAPPAKPPPASLFRSEAPFEVSSSASVNVVDGLLGRTEDCVWGLEGDAVVPVCAGANLDERFFDYLTVWNRQTHRASVSTVADIELLLLDEKLSKTDVRRLCDKYVMPASFDVYAAGTQSAATDRVDKMVRAAVATMAGEEPQHERHHRVFLRRLLPASAARPSAPRRMIPSAALPLERRKWSRAIRATRSDAALSQRRWTTRLEGP